MKEVKRVKKIVLMIAVALVALAMLATPVLAYGPWEAKEKNPLLTLDGDAILNMETPSGVTHRWHISAPDVNPYRSRDFTLYRPASGNDNIDKVAALQLLVWDGPVYTGSITAYQAALPKWIGTWIYTKLASKTSNALALQYENKWIYMSSDYVRGMWFLGYYKTMGVDNALAYADYFADVLWPNGVYFKYNNIGQ